MNPNGSERLPITRRRAVWWTVFRKEWRELVRDGRSLRFTLLLPIVVVPAAILLVGGLGTTPVNPDAALRARQAMAVFLPMFLTMFCFLGCMYPAIDLFAGEKERRTLETLWLTPVARHQLAMGKILLCASTGWISAMLCLSVFWSGGRIAELLPGSVLPGAKSWMSSVSELTFSSALLICGWVGLLSMSFAAGLLAISAKASSFKEAQSMMTPVYIGLTLAMAPLFSGRELASTPKGALWGMVPVINLMLQIQQTLKQKFSWPFASITLASTLLTAALMFFLCLRCSRREHSFQ